MIHFTLSVAETVFAVFAFFPQTKAFCADYLVEQPASVDAVIQSTHEGLAQERALAVLEAFPRGEQFDCSDVYLEPMLLYREIARYFADHNGAVFHGALIERQGAGYLFTAKSGVGKSTHIFNWLKEYPDTTVVNGDKPILRLTEDGVLGYGTPWCGKEGLQTNKSVPIRAIILVERAAENAIAPIAPVRAFPKLLTQCFCLEDDRAVERCTDFCLALAKSVKLYRLQCNREQTSAKVAFEGMNPS